MVKRVGKRIKCKLYTITAGETKVDGVIFFESFEEEQVGKNERTLLWG